MTSYIVNKQGRRIHRSPSLEQCNCDDIQVRGLTDARGALELVAQDWKACKRCLPEGIALEER